MLQEILEYFRPSRRVRHVKAAVSASARKSKQPLPTHRTPAAAISPRLGSVFKAAAPERPGLWQKITQPSEFNMFLGLVYAFVVIVIVFFKPALFQHGRWEALLDLNRDGHFTITDLFYWCFWLFYLPGDVMISVLMQMPAPAAFFELDGQSFGGIGSLMVSALYWWLMGGPVFLLAGLLPIVIQTFLRA